MDFLTMLGDYCFGIICGVGATFFFLAYQERREDAAKMEIDTATQSAHDNMRKALEGK